MFTVVGDYGMGENVALCCVCLCAYVVDVVKVYDVGDVVASAVKITVCAGHALRL